MKFFVLLFSLENEELFNKIKGMIHIFCFVLSFEKGLFSLNKLKSQRKRLINSMSGENFSPSNKKEAKFSRQGEKMNEKSRIKVFSAILFIRVIFSSLFYDDPRHLSPGMGQA